MNDLKHRYLDAMGIPVWIRRGNEPTSVAMAEASTENGSSSEWTSLEAEVAACTQCELHRTRTQTVFGVGNHAADLMIVGEAPGADEDRQGKPFVGRAGKLLNAMLTAIGFTRDAVYIANILKCRPPKNRDPRPEEVVCCEPYLERQIALLSPRVILAVGRIAAQNLLKSTTPIGRMRGQRYSYGEMQIPMVVTYHPAYLLRSPLQKRRAWDDLKFAKTLLEEAQ